MTNPAFTQTTFRLRKDDGNETGATWLANQGVDISLSVNEPVRVRFLIDETAARVWTNKTWNLYYSQNAGAYTAIGDGVVNFSASNNFAQGDDTTSQLTGGSGAFLVNNNGMCESAGATSTGAAGNYFEVEYCIIIQGENAANNDTFDFRVYDSASALTTYTDTPRITALKTAINKSESISLTEDRSVLLPDALAIDKNESISISSLEELFIELFASKSDTIFIVDTPEVFAVSADTAVSKSETVSVTDTPDVDAPYEVLPPLFVFPVGWKTGVKIVG